MSLFGSPLARLPAVVLAAAAVALWGAAGASADRSGSRNWAGYAAHGPSFESVSARWRQPRPVCVQGHDTFSAMWVGLGGYSTTSNALEQIGTELDCRGGRVASSGFYELVPAASNYLAMPVRPGDLMAAKVAVSGKRVTLTLENLTRRRRFEKTFTTQYIDISSAEWILEAPSACIEGTMLCRVLPLTDFRHAQFTVARATAIGGAPEPIGHTAWSHTRITLGPDGPQFVSNRRDTVPFGAARPSPLINRGSSFKIAYVRRYVPAAYGARAPLRPDVSAPLQRRTARASRSGPTYLRH